MSPAVRPPVWIPSDRPVIAGYAGAGLDRVRPDGWLCGGGGRCSHAEHRHQHQHGIFECGLGVNRGRGKLGAVAASFEGMAASRLNWLLGAQNPDGGWGYSQGKASWLEPTAYALRALGAWAMLDRMVPSGRRAQRYIDRLQRADGGWQASALVFESHWSGALWLGLEGASRERHARWLAGLRWLVAEKGMDGGWIRRVAARLDPEAVEQDMALRGWPWLAGTNSWVEPTCHAMLALSRDSLAVDMPGRAARLEEGRRLLLDRRCRDGGWNYGNRRVRGHDLPSYPQTTALALLTLKRCGVADLQASVEQAQRQWADPSVSRLARVWLALALREAGHPVQLDESGASQGSATGMIVDTITAALEAAAWSSQGYA